MSKDERKTKRQETRELSDADEPVLKKLKTEKDSGGKRLIIILENAQLETAKVSQRFVP